MWAHSVCSARRFNSIAFSCRYLSQTVFIFCIFFCGFFIFFNFCLAALSMDGTFFVHFCHNILCEHSNFFHRVQSTDRQTRTHSHTNVLLLSFALVRFPFDRLCDDIFSLFHSALRCRETRFFGFRWVHLIGQRSLNLKSCELNVLEILFHHFVLGHRLPSFCHRMILFRFSSTLFFWRSMSPFDCRIWIALEHASMFCSHFQFRFIFCIRRVHLSVDRFRGLSFSIVGRLLWCLLRDDQSLICALTKF